MNFLVRLKKDHAILFSIFIALFALALMMLGGIILIPFIPLLGEEYYTLLLAQEIFALVFLVLLTYLSGNGYVLTRRGAGLGHAAQVAAYPIVFILLIAVTMAAVGVESGAALQSPYQIIIYFAAMLSIGLVEEIAFRGIIAQTLIEHYGTDYFGTWKATIISGIIFGVAHMSNIFSAQAFGVLVQVAVASVLGMLFAAIYFRTGSLWICILLHAGLDAGSLLDTGLFVSDTTIVDVVSSFSLINLTPCLTYGLPILFLLRKRKNFEVQFWFNRPAKQTDAAGAVDSAE